MAFSNTKKFDAFLQNEDNFIAVSYNDPRAVEIRAKSAAKNTKKTANRAEIDSATANYAATFEVGQIVKNKNRPMIFGEIVEINGTVITVSVGGTLRKFDGSVIVLA